MKINIRHEPATEADDPRGSEASPDRACVWIVGDDGETTDTKYLEGEEEVTLDAEAVFGPQTAAPAGTADNQARAHVAALLRTPEVPPADRDAAEEWLKEQGGEVEAPF